MRRKQVGSSFMEVLVTFVVVSLGLLGIGLLFVKGQMMSDESYQRFQAASIAHELSERLAANKAEAAKGTSSGYKTALSGGSIPGAAAPTGYVNCQSATATCTSAQIATYDLTNFHDALTGAQKVSGSQRMAALVSARGCVEYLGVAGSNDDPPRYRVSVAWMGRMETWLPETGISDCAKDTYNNEKLRRVVSLEVQVL